MEYVLRHLPAHPEIATTVRSLWTTNFLYFSFDCPYTKLTTFTPASKVERNGLWERDVVEVFLATDPRNPRRYTEFELAPTNEKLDIALDAPKWDLTWNSGFETAVRVDETAGRWYAELRIPLKALVTTPPTAGTQWRLNLFRSDREHEAFLAWSTPLANSTHVPERFGTLVFVTK